MRLPLLALLAITPMASSAEEPPEVLAALLAETPPAERFTDAFRDAVPMWRLRAILAGLRSEIGPVQSIGADGDGFLIETDSHRVRATITLDGEGRIAGLFFEPPQTRAPSLDAALAALATLPGSVAWHITRDGTPIADRSGNRPVEVASAFKIGVLATLVRQGVAGEEVLHLKPRHKSLPSGRLQTFPDGAPVTVATAATLMIAESDNTATDLLIDWLGRAAVAETLSLLPAEFLTTREAFVLKADPSLRADWRTDPAAAAERLADAALPTAGAVAAAGRTPGVGWALPLDRLCALIEEVAAHPVMSINPGPATASDWARASYKGGSDTGVLSFVHFLEHGDGHRYCAAMAITSDTEIDLSAALAAWTPVLGALHRPD